MKYGCRLWLVKQLMRTSFILIFREGGETHAEDRHGHITLEHWVTFSKLKLGEHELILPAVTAAMDSVGDRGQP